MMYRNLLLVFLCTGCAGPSLNVQSTPDKAEVFLIREGQQPVRLGATPLTTPTQSLGIQSHRSVQLRVEKAGHRTESFLIPGIMFESQVQISTKLEEDKVPVSCQQQSTAIEKVANGVARAQFLLQTKKFDRAEATLQNLINDYPDSSTLWDLLGNVYYLDKRLEKALEAYQESLRLNPENAETKRMVRKLGDLTSVRVPSSRGGL